MADALDMSLDDLISKNRSARQQSHPRGRGRGGGPASAGPAPAALRHRFGTRAAAAPYHRGAAGFQARPRRPVGIAGYGAARPQPPMAAGAAALDAPTKLHISNLDYGVSNDDIKELFSDVGDISRYSINYDKSGRSKGTAEVVFSRKCDALAAVKRYNNVQLDGKPMKIEIIGTSIEAPPTFAFNPPAANFRVPFNPPAANFKVPFIKSGPGRGGAGGWPRGRGGFGGRGSRGRGRGGRGSGQASAEDLDADLDKYHAARMETS